MVRLVRLTLNHVRNVRHGELDFRTLPSGGSVTGIYGPNGSGKTTVITVINLLRRLMSGNQLSADVGELIGIGSSSMSVDAVFSIDGSTVLSYTVVIAKVHGVPVVEGETVRMGSTPDKLGRPVVTWEREGDRAPNLKPLRLWAGFLGRRELRDCIVRADGEARTLGRSFVFHPEITTVLPAASRGLSRPLNRQTRQTLERLPMPLFDALRMVSDYARNDIIVLAATRNEDGCGDPAIGLPSRPTAVTRQAAGRFHALVNTFNLVLPALVPGLELRLIVEDTNVILDNGDTGVRIAVQSVRDGQVIPFHYESDGIRRLIRMMAFLIRACNDADACIAIDGMDSGVDEILFGNLLEVLAGSGVGQLIFTAHDLQALEVLPLESIVFATMDPDSRFAGINVPDGGNLRGAYLRLLGSERLAAEPDRGDVAFAFHRAGMIDENSGETDHD